ncbi:hypothetical protein ES705_19647 [subsurface metagenome]
MINRLKDEKGQILPFAALTLLALVMFWMTVVNVGKMIRDRIMLQNAADAAAQSAACAKAKALNSIGLINASLGMPVVALGVPYFVWLPYCHHTVPKGFIEILIRFQDALYHTSGTLALGIAREVARENGADELIYYSPKFLMDGSLKRYTLERNEGTIVYFDTTIVYVLGIPVPIPWPYHKYRNAKRWLELKEDEDEIHDALRVTVIAVKNPERGFFPLGKGLLGIDEMPAIYAIASARPYNTKGPMFPSHGRRWGVSALREYFSARSGGYDAHLIPVEIFGREFQH